MYEIIVKSGLSVVNSSKMLTNFAGELKNFHNGEFRKDLTPRGEEIGRGNIRLFTRRHGINSTESTTSSVSLAPQSGLPMRLFTPKI
ncbi:MAG: hypothetical protein GTO13_02845 [Proteobacteria bacterium]|nr:hypothetical protein [Pseudomonadota bacterium]